VRGRHGYNVVSPWYDGRGHQFTIIDSPSIQVEGRSCLASALTTRDVQEVLWEYGDPARFVEVIEAHLFRLEPVQLQPGWEDGFRGLDSVSSLCPELYEEVRRTLSGEDSGSPVQVFEPRSFQPSAEGVKPTGIQLWCFSRWQRPALTALRPGRRGGECAGSGPAEQGSAAG
jgi:hypothetical protein